MEQKDIAKWSSVLNQSRLKGQAIKQISHDVTEFSRAEAYSIQEQGLQFRLQNGESLVGYKMGLTSEAKRKQMNLDSPLYGVLTNKMQVASGGVFALKGSIHPKIEPEVAFLLAADLPAMPSREQVLQSTEAVCACLEILDSRYEGFKYFSMEDVIADNSSSSHFVVGPWIKDFKNIPLENLNMQMMVNGVVAQTGNSRDISGDPVVSVQQLCELLAQRGLVAKKGMVILAGAATTAVALEPQMTVSLKVDSLPVVEVSVEKGE